MSIPLSKDFSITPGVVSPAGSALNANGLMLTDNALIPADAPYSFYSASEVAALLGSTTDEYAAAVVYFNGYDNSSVTPGELLMARLRTSDQAGSLLSASLKGVLLSTLQSLPAGTFTITVDGAKQTSKSVDLAGAANQSAIAALLQAAVTGVTVTWNSVANRFMFVSETTGANSNVSFASATGLTTGLGLTEDAGAIVSTGFAATPAADVMDNITSNNQDWVGFTIIPEVDDIVQVAMAEWVSSQHSRYFFVLRDTDASATVANSTSALVPASIASAGYASVFPVYGDHLVATTPLAYAASLNFDQMAGRVTYKFREFSGVTPNVTSLAVANALESNGYNYYGKYSQNATGGNYAATGMITGDFLWLDSFVGQVWMNASIVAAFYALFTNNQSYSYNAQGYASVQAAVIDVASAAKNFGAIQTGVTLDKSQIRQITNVVGKDISSTLYSEGWYLHIPTQTGANRILRNLAGVIFYYVDGQMIQSIDMSSIAVL